jgi:putative membrane protein
MSKRNTTLATAVFAGLLALAPAFAQKQLSSQDQKFMMDAAKGGMMEVELGRLATQKASSADVKSFGQRMVDDHSKANDQLKSIATQKGVTLPTTLPADMKQEMDKISKLSGAEFDKMYMSHMLKDHKKDVSEFEKEASKGDDSSVKGFAQQTLPTLREHLTMAQSVATKVGAEDHSMHGSKQ